MESGATPVSNVGQTRPSQTVHSVSSASACEPYREVIEQGLPAGRNAMSIWPEPVDRLGFGDAYETVKRFVREQRGTQTPEAQADYGTLTFR